MRLSAVALTIATVSSMAGAQVDPGVVNNCIQPYCKQTPQSPEFAECVCGDEMDDVMQCVWNHWSSLPGGLAEHTRAMHVIADWCSTR
ncbi:hypothetical protein K523DRAFT_245568 [Schizophyllum commune Tattone D]|nr:hypothetical protein K523DRAFT_245568 [Schizophyllum commune Tattone D]